VHLARPEAPDNPRTRQTFVANIKSQLKRIKTNEKARQRNKAVKSSLKTAVRKFRTAAAAGDTDKATAALRDASRALDKAVSKGVIHKNNAANRKSAMARQATKL
jgi:small subunit ribosomal protein S20